MEGIWIIALAWWILEKAIIGIKERRFCRQPIKFVSSVWKWNALVMFCSGVSLQPRFGTASLKPKTRWDLSSNSLKSYGWEALAANCRLKINHFKAHTAQERLLSSLPSALCGFFHMIFMHISPNTWGFALLVQDQTNPWVLPET